MNFPDLRSRRDRLNAQLSERRLDGVIVSHPPNVRYLSGFTGSNAALLVCPGEAELFTDPRYELQSAGETDCRVRVESGPLLAAVAARIRRKHLKTIAFESEYLTWADHDTLSSRLAAGVQFHPAGNLVSELRMVKSPIEIAAIRAAVQTASAAFAKVLAALRPGASESEVAAELDYQMRLLGARGPAFPTIVASGVRTAFPHAEPTDRRLGNNELLLIDMGALREGYMSDMTRMSFFGRPGRTVRDRYRAVLEAQCAALDAVRDGVSSSTVDRRARQTLRSYGLDGFFSHSTGHGLGLEIHEPPKLGKSAKGALRAGMVVTVEPGVYIEGFGGIRIEDTVVVTRKCCEILTPTAKELFIM